MKNTLYLFFGIAFMAACDGNGDTQLEQKQAELGEKRKELSALQTEIQTLETEIAELDTTVKKVERTPVQVQKLSVQKFEHFVELTGTVTSEENIMISAEAGGRVESIPAKEGQKVSRGQVLVRIENERIANQLNEAQSSFELAETTYQKRKNLWDQGIGSEIEYLQSKNQYEGAKSRVAQIRSQYSNTIIKAPINGTVDDISVKEGEFVNIGSPIVRVVDLKNVEIEAELSEEYLPAVSKGDSVRVKIPALGIDMKSPVSFVSQVINPNNRSFKIKVKLDNKDGRIKPNVLANLMIRDYQNADALIVPTKSIQKDLKGDYVWVVTDEGGEQKATKKRIETGKVASSKTEVKTGLAAGDKVVVTGFEQVTEGKVVRTQSSENQPFQN